MIVLYSIILFDKIKCYSSFYRKVYKHKKCLFVYSFPSFIPIPFQINKE